MNRTANAKDFLPRFDCFRSSNTYLACWYIASTRIFDETRKGPGGALPNIARSLRLFVIKPHNKAGCTIPHSVKSHMGRTWFP
ncbi:hypothetical protein HMPREF1155_1746 [Slackia sp. CM382]|nr:hypothetical protein HMPREF1155_1746 [Slackia sp. CM382]